MSTIVSEWAYSANESNWAPEKPRSLSREIFNTNKHSAHSQYYGTPNVFSHWIYAIAMIMSWYAAHFLSFSTPFHLRSLIICTWNLKMMTHTQALNQIEPNRTKLNPTMYIYSTSNAVQRRVHSITLQLILFHMGRIT